MENKTEDFSPRIIRAWLDTVINPLIDGLELEYDFIQRDNLTWRSFKQSFDVLKSLQSYINSGDQGNFEQCSGYNPIIIAIIENHDIKLRKLAEACFALFVELSESKILKEKYFEAVNEYEKKSFWY